MANTVKKYFKKINADEKVIEELCLMTLIERDLVAEFTEIANQNGMDVFLDTEEPPTIRGLAASLASRK